MYVCFYRPRVLDVHLRCTWRLFGANQADLLLSHQAQAQISQGSIHLSENPKLFMLL